VFPVDLDHPVFRYGSGGAVIEGEREQLPNACRDYYSVDAWADLSDRERGMALATPDAPLVLWGGFTVGSYAAHHTADRPMLIGWPMHNKWHTNFRHAQPGEVRLRYRLWPHPTPFDRAETERFGLTAALPLLAIPAVRGEGGALESSPAGTRTATERLLVIRPDAARIVDLIMEGPDRVSLIVEPFRAVTGGILAWGPGRRIVAAWETALDGHRLRQAKVDAGAVSWSGEAGHWIAWELHLERAP
jgi:hypothetical protein